MKISEIKNSDKIEITVNKYVPLDIKRQTIEMIINGSIKFDDNGFISFDEFKYSMLKSIGVAMIYGNIEFDGVNQIDDYNILMEKDIIYSLEHTEEIEHDLDLFESLLWDIKNDRLKENSVELTAKKFSKELLNLVKKAVDKVPDQKEMGKFLNSIPKKLDKINPESNQFMVDLFSQKGFQNDIALKKEKSNG